MNKCSLDSMLLSLYVSFRLSSSTQSELPIHMLLMTGFAIVVSLLSTFTCMLWLWIMLLYPFWLVSFPFFSTPELFFGDFGPLTGYHISFFGSNIFSISPQNVLVYGFSFYLIINLGGALLGYLAGKVLRDKSFEWDILDFFFRYGILSFLVCCGVVWLGWFALQYMVWYGVNHVLFAFVENILFFCQYFFWVPSLLITIIYAVRSRPRKDAT